MPFMLIFSLLLIVASFIIKSLSSKDAQGPKPQSAVDFQFPQSAEGQPQAVIFGDCWSNDHQILWYGGFRNSPIKKSSGTKKG